MEIIFFQKIKNDGGPKSFQKKFIRWFYSKNINFSFLSYKNFFKKKYLFINAGSLKLVTVLLQKILGSIIIQRLNGFYDLKNIDKKLFLKCFLINFSMQFIRKYISNLIIYQSKTSKQLWDKNFGEINKPFEIIYNPSFTPLIKKKNSKNKKTLSFDLLIVEGNIDNQDYNVKFLKYLEVAAVKINQINKIYIFGNVNKNFFKHFKTKKKIIFMKSVRHKYLRKFYNSKNLIFIGFEFNPSCSNSLIETMPYGIPSLCLNTGSYKELVGKAGIQIDFSKIDDVNLTNKIKLSLEKIVFNYNYYSKKTLINSYNFLPNKIFNKYVSFIKKNENFTHS